MSTAAGPRTLADLVELDEMASDWADALRAVDPEIDGRITKMRAFLATEEASGRGFLPAREAVFAAFRRPLADVRVLIVGQDPYPTPGHPIGLSFAVARDVRPLPPSLTNIYRELESDLGLAPPAHGDLTAWADQGVMLLNRVLTVGAGRAHSHEKRGWEAVTEIAIAALVARGGPCAAILWGVPARKLKTSLAPIPVVESSHPSPLAVWRDFYGSQPFSKVNALLVEQGADPIDWRLNED